MTAPQPGKTVFEHLPPELRRERKSPWIAIILIVVCILFGIFWLIQKDRPLPPGDSTSLSTTAETPSEPSAAPQAPEDDIASLMTATINTPIPQFSTRL